MNDERSDTERAEADDDVVVRARTDRSAFGLLFDRYYPRVLRYCLRRLPDRASAEDVTADVFVQVASHLSTFTGTSETDFRRWLFRITTNAVHAQLRQAGRRQALRDAAARDGSLDRHAASETLADPLDWRLVHQAIAELDEREQTIVTLRFFAGCTHEEIADVVGATTGAVRTALSRALARLREKLKPLRPAGPDG